MPARESNQDGREAGPVAGAERATAGAAKARRIPVVVVLPPRTLLLDAAGPLEVLRRANLIQQRVRFDVRAVAATRTVRTSVGLHLAQLGALPRRLPDAAIVVVAGAVETLIDASGPEPGEAAANARIVAWLRSAIRPGMRLATICSGALLAARAGLLDGHACTTHHLSCTELAALAPRARVFDNRLFVDDGERLSSAGVTAGIDLMLHLVAQLVDHACALAVARYLVVYLRRSGSDPQLSPWLDGRNHIHPAVHRVQDAIAADPARPWPARQLARIASTSPRHLSRLFHSHTGMHLAAYRNRLRAALAHELVAQTQLRIERVAERAGFASARQLRRAWKECYGGTPRAARTQAADA